MLAVKLQQVLLLWRQQVVHKDFLISKFLQNLTHVHFSIKLSYTIFNDLFGKFILLSVKASDKSLMLLHLHVISLTTADFLDYIVIAFLLYNIFNVKVG